VFPASDSPAHFEELKRYVRFSADDAALLAILCDRVRASFEDIAREFYERIREHEEAHAVFENEQQILRLRASLVRWMERVLTGPYDGAYAQKSAQIGHVHVKVGLPQRFMFGAMSLIRMRLQELANRTMGAEAPAACAALSRILDIELALMNQTYLDDLVLHAQSVERQIKERERSALARDQRGFVRAVELAGALIIGLDGNARIRLFNPEAERVTGRRFTDIHETPFAELLPEDDRATFAEMWAELCERKSGTMVPFGFKLSTRTHRTRELAGFISGSLMEDDSDVAFILAGRDVTEERVLAERLKQSERLASVGTLAAGLAHEIRNPLNGAQLHLTFLKRALGNAGDPELPEAVQVVAGEIQRLSALVTEFLDFARPSALKVEPVNIADLCRRVMGVVQSAGDGVSIGVDLPTTELVAEIDPAKIEQVLLNLMHNGIEAVAYGGGSQVTLRAYREPRSAVIEVADDGPGLSSPTAPIFDAFYSTKPGGTGLGLAIVHRIVTTHDGEIIVETKPGATVFRVRLPLRNAARALLAPTPPPVEEAEESRT
jgi:PAS domain S-box-containing protein